MSIPNPPAKVSHNIETAFVRFINQGTFRTTKELIFTPKQFGGLGIPKIFDFWDSLRIAWLRRAYHSNSFWLTLLTESISGHKNQLMNHSQSEFERAFSYRKNPFWKGVLTSWPSVRKNYKSKNAVTDRTFHCQNIFHNNQISGGKTLPFETHFRHA